MEKSINIDNCFDSEEDRYYEPKRLTKVLESILGKSFDKIKKEIKDTQISVTPQQIMEYLETLFEEESPEIKELAERKKSENIGNYDKIEAADRNRSLDRLTKEFMARLMSSEYTFDQYDLDYFDRYVAIVRRKLNKLIEIIESISSGDTVNVSFELTSLDIILDANGSILKSDIERLVIAAVNNFYKLKEKVEEANDYSSYIKKRRERHQPCSDNEIYPNSRLQENSLRNDSNPCNVRLSKGQKEKLHEDEGRSMQRVVEFMRDLGI